MHERRARAGAARLEADAQRTGRPSSYEQATQTQAEQPVRAPVRRVAAGRSQEDYAHGIQLTLVPLDVGARVGVRVRV